MIDAMASCGCFLVCVIAVVICCILPSQGIRYEPNWKSIDSRPLPSWYDEGKVGIFIHWGVFSVPSFVSEWFWWYWKGTKPEPAVVQFMEQNYPPDFTYADFASRFTAEFYDPQQWADIFNASGARYIVLTSKHHEGFCNWPTKVSFNWNSMEVGPKRDLVGELANAIRSKTNLHFGLYHSLFEWFNPIYRQDSANNFTSQDFVKDKTMPELYELVMQYKPDVVWSDGDAGPDTYWNSTNFLAWLYNDSPVKDTVVTNDRWGNGCGCKHGGFLTCADRYNPGKLQNKKWENCLTIDKRSWGYRRNANLADFMSADEIITTLAETVSCGGNMLINVGPTHDGMIAPIFEERLRQMGAWLQVNGEAIYSSVPWSFQNDTVTPNVWYTSRKDTASGGTVVYAIVLKWPASGSLYLYNPSTTSSTTITLLGYPFPLQFTGSKGVTITVPDIPSAELPCQHGWVFKMTNIAN